MITTAMQAKHKIYVLRFLFFGALKYGINCAKNSVKVLLGRKTYFSQQDKLFWLYFLQLIGLQQIRKITCVDFLPIGAASQALTVMYAINFARACGLTYVHTPFAEIDHADRPMREWVNAWETHFNLGLGEVTADSGDRDIVNFAYNFENLLVLYGLDLEALTRTFNTTIPEFRRKYYSNKPPRKNEILTVCVHVRRGDVTPGMTNMWTDVSIIAKTLAELRAILDAHCIKYRVCVLSQGDYAGVAELECPGVEFFLNTDAIWSIQEAIEADILIMAKSNFSYIAALISDGIKIYEPWFYPPLSTWLIRDSSGEFDRAAFELELLRHIEVRET